MPITQQIAFIGAGNMATAIALGLVGRGGVDPQRITMADPSEAQLQAAKSAIGCRTTTDNAEALASADVVVLATKPQVFDSVLPGLKAALDKQIANGANKAAPLFISIAAGLCAERIESLLGNNVALVRTMPNTPALVSQGVTALCKGSHATKAHLDIARLVFEAVGSVVEVDESLMDAVTAVSGSGPAYVFRFVEALTAAGVAEGLDEAVALQLAKQTVLGAATLLNESGEAPSTLRERVSSKGGTTLAGLGAMTEHKFDETIQATVRAAAARSKELREQKS